MQFTPLIIDFSTKIQAYFALSKFRLSALVVFSGGFGFVFATENTIDWLKLGIFCLASFLITASANTINQIIEKDLDKLMTRTAKRPLPTEKLSIGEARLFSILLAMVGTLLLMFFVNILTAFFAVLSLILYAFVYTPMKQRTPIAVFVGAFPGAFPPLIGWVAQTGELSIAAFIIFGIQFIWQFPHFWAIAWVADEDYSRAGFRLLPSAGGKDGSTAFQIMTYTMFLIPMGLLPMYYGITGLNSAIVVTLASMLFLVPTLYLVKNLDRTSALRIMFASFLYLPIVQIAFLLDKL